MYHVTLSVVLKNGVKLPTAQQRWKEVQDAGGLIHIDTNHVTTARKLSKLPWVDRVVATSVIEMIVGTWRKGKLS